MSSDALVELLHGRTIHDDVAAWRIDVYSIVDAVLWRPLPYPEGHRVMSLAEQRPRESRWFGLNAASKKCSDPALGRLVRKFARGIKGR